MYRRSGIVGGEELRQIGQISGKNIKRYQREWEAKITKCRSPQVPWKSFDELYRHP